MVHFSGFFPNSMKSRCLRYIHAAPEMPCPLFISSGEGEGLVGGSLCSLRARHWATCSGALQKSLTSRNCTWGQLSQLLAGSSIREVCQLHCELRTGLYTKPWTRTAADHSKTWGRCIFLDLILRMEVFIIGLPFPPPPHCSPLSYLHIQKQQNAN